MQLCPFFPQVSCNPMMLNPPSLAYLLLYNVEFPRYPAASALAGNNTIAMSNLCRDESCMILEDKIEVGRCAVFFHHHTESQG